jgi:hypothetical protein
MRKLICTVLGAAGVALAALSAPAGAAPPTPCKTGSLKLSLNLIPNSQGAGNVVYKLRVTNRSASDCSLGPPTIVLLGRRGSVLPSHSHATGGLIVIGANSTATSNARFSPDIPGTGDKQKGQCQPTAYKVKASFNGSSGTVTGPVKPPTPVCERGSMSLTALRQV